MFAVVGEISSSIKQLRAKCFQVVLPFQNLTSYLNFTNVTVRYIKIWKLVAQCLSIIVETTMNVFETY